MEGVVRRSGIEVIGDVPWGTHFCLFYQSRQDLIDVLVPYFKAGLENNEFCMCITSEPFKKADVEKQMARAMPGFDKYLKNGQMEILAYDEWYTIDGVFDSNRVLNGWVEKLRKAQENGFSGLRLTGNTFWLEKAGWKGFMDYENGVNDTIGQHNMVALCTYSLDRCDAGDILDVVGTHQFALTRREGEWKRIESVGLKETKESLRESEANLVKSQEIAHIGSWVLDLMTSTIIRSAESYRIFGHAPGEGMIDFEDFLDHIVPEDRARVAQTIRSTMETGIPYNITYRIRRNDGELRILASAGEVMKDSSGHILKLFGTNQDITESKRAEEALRQNDEHLRLASLAAGIGVWSWTPGTSDVVVSDSWRRMFGVAPDARVTFETWRDLLHPEDREHAVAMLNNAVEEHCEYNVEYRIVRPDGSVRWVVDRGRARYDENGRAVNMSGVESDITERKLAEDERKKLINDLGERVKEQKALYSIAGIFQQPREVSELLQDVVSVLPTAWKYPDVTSVRITYGGREYCSSLFRQSPWRQIADFSTSDGKRGSIEVFYAEEMPPEVEGPFIAEERGLINSLADMLHTYLDRKLAEEALRESEGSLAKAQAITHLANWEMDVRKGGVRGSKELYRMLNLEPDFTLDAFIEKVHPDDRARVSESINAAIYEGKPYNIDYRIVPRPGEIYHIHAEGQVINDRNGQPLKFFGTIHDITERRMMEEKLQFTQFALEKFGDSAIWLSSDGRIAYVNEAACRSLGYANDELLSMYIWEIDPDYTREKYLQRWDEMKRNSRLFKFEARHLARDGRIFPVEVTSCYTRYGDREYLITFDREITERKQAEKELWETRDYLESLINYANAPIIVWDPAFTITQFNHAFERLSGYHEGEVLGKNLKMLFPPDSIDESLEKIRSTLTGERWESVEIPILRKDGDVRIALWNSANIYGKTDVLLATIAQGQDITERKQAQDSLDRYKLLSENARDIVLFVHRDGSIIEANEAAIKAYGYSREELLSMSVYDLRASDPGQRVEEQMDIAYEGGILFEALHRRKDGSIFPVEVNSQGRNIHGQNILLSVVRDITERKQAEAALVEAKQQAELYVDLMGHDINNMNHLALGYLELALEKLETEKKLNQDDRMMIESPMQTLANSSALIKNVRKLQSLTTEGVKVMPTDINKIFRELEGMSFHSNGREVIMSIPNVPGVMVEANELLKDVFTNLITNAVKHSDEEKPLTITVNANSVMENGRRYLKCMVEDNGPGIPDWLKDKLFNRFQRGTTKTHGKGLGLYLVRTLVEGYRGKVWVEDRVHGDHTKGARFVVMLPIAVEK